MAHSPLSTSAPSAGPAVADVLDLSVVVVTYNVREFLEQALESLQTAATGLTVETFVVDNDSADGTADAVRDRFPDVRLIANEENVGFATANNQAIREARGRYVLVLNPDTLVQEDTLREMVAFMDAHPDAGAVGCRILNPDGTFAPESRRAFPTPAVAFYRISGMSRLFPRSPQFGRYNLTYLPQDEVCEVDALSGSCMMVRREALERGHDGGEGAGLFDESFFMYGEDLDWCYRIQQAGWRIYYTPTTQIVHYKGESTKKGDLRYVVLFYGAMLRFVEKHLAGDASAGWAEFLGRAALALGLRLGIVARAGLAAVGRLSHALRAPATDLGLTWAVLVVTAAVRAWAGEFAFAPGYYGAVLPLYAVVFVAAVGLMGGYGRARRPLRAIPIGGGLSFLAVSTVSLFVPAVAFSRATLLVGTLGAVALALLNRARRWTSPAEARRTLLVGSSSEALRLQRLLAGRVRPAVQIVGHVAAQADPAAEDPAPPYLGPPRQLRALARLQDVDEVVFASDSLTNTAILDGMRTLRDLPIQLKILASGRDRIIGKASVEDLSAPLLEAERTIAPLRSPSARRVLELPIASAFVLLAPALRLAARLRPTVRLRRLAAFAARMPSVLAGRRALVGYDPTGPHPPPAWGLMPAVVSILDTLPSRPDTIVEAHRSYWFYARNQSVWLDLDVLLKALAKG